jgi:hypothetical protein
MSQDKPPSTHGRQKLVCGCRGGRWGGAVDIARQLQSLNRLTVSPSRKALGSIVTRTKCAVDLSQELNVRRIKCQDTDLETWWRTAL